MSTNELKEARGFAQHEPVPVYSMNESGTRATYDLKHATDGDHSPEEFFGTPCYVVGCPMKADEEIDRLGDNVVVDDVEPVARCIGCLHLRGLGRKARTGTPNLHEAYELLCSYPKRRKVTKWAANPTDEQRARTAELLDMRGTDPKSPLGVACWEMFANNVSAVNCPVAFDRRGSWYCAPVPCLACKLFAGLFRNVRTGEFRIRCAYPESRSISFASPVTDLGEFSL